MARPKDARQCIQLVQLYDKYVIAANSTAIEGDHFEHDSMSEALEYIAGMKKKPGVNYGVSHMRHESWKVT